MKNNIKYPSKDRLQKMNKKLKNVEGTFTVSINSTSAEKFRWDLCQSLVKYMVQKK